MSISRYGKYGKSAVSMYMGLMTRDIDKTRWGESDNYADIGSTRKQRKRKKRKRQMQKVSRRHNRKHK